MTKKQEIEIQDKIYKKLGYIEETPLKIKISNLYKNLGLFNSEYFNINLSYEKIKILCKMYVLCLKTLTTNLEFLRTKIYIENTDKDYILKRLQILRNIKNNINIKDLTVDDVIKLDIDLYNLMKNIEFNAKVLGFNFFKYLSLFIDLGYSRILKF